MLNQIGKASIHYCKRFRPLFIFGETRHTVNAMFEYKHLTQYIYLIYSESQSNVETVYYCIMLSALFV